VASGNGESSVSPPSGAGSVPGLGEAFRMNLNTGQGVYSYALAVPEGVAGHKPKLTLEYTHGTRSGPFGFGWQLAVRSIVRRLDLGVPGQGPETYLDGSNEITALKDGTFGALSETAFSRYTRDGNGWRIEDRNGDVWELGLTPGARIADPARPTNVQCWLAERWLDVSGNVVTFTWDTSTGVAYLTEVRYAAYALRFHYEPRPDIRSDGRAGFLCTLAQRCQSIDLVIDPGATESKLRSWALSYEVAVPARISLLSSIQLRSFATAATSGGDVVRPPARFQYGAFDPAEFNVGYYPANGSDPPPLDDPGATLITLDQAPLPGVLEISEGKQFYWRNNGAGWDYPEALPSAPFGGSIQSAGATFIDMNGNGKADLTLLATGYTAGYFENDGQRGWGAFVAYPRNASATPDWSGGRLRFADNDMDGRIDAIETIDRGLVLWRNGGTLGWGAPTVVSAPADGGAIDFTNPLVVLADMTGDGASDIVAISSGAVRYWPALGNGRFAASVLMSNSPRLRGLQANPDQVFLTDIDGDGCADLVYVQDDHVMVCVNQNGAGFGDPVVLSSIPAPIPGTVRPVNLTGTPAAGLVWNSYRTGRKVSYAHLEFSPKSTPYLLSSVDNGSGLVSQIFYRSAVNEYLDDRRDGTIWDTNFPFPLFVVSGTRETDQVTGVTTDVKYRYHDVHYQPDLRRFEGFRTAERIEKGDQSRADTKTVHQFLMAMERMPGNSIDDAVLNGMLAQVDVYSLDGSGQENLPLCTEKSEYAVVVLDDTVDGRHRTFVALSKNTTLDIERTADARGEEKSYTYDAVGNVVREVHRGFGTKAGVALADQVRTTEVRYAASATHRVLDKPASVVVRDGAGKLVAETQIFYDGPDFTGLALRAADRGLLTRRLKLAWAEAEFNAHYDASMDGATALGFIAGDDADGTASLFIAEVRHAYDARGLKIADMDPLGVQNKYTFDADGLFRTGLAGPLGTTVFDYDRGAAQPRTVTYPNGEIARFAYDAQGRLVSSATPSDDPASPPRRFAYNDAVIPHVRTARMLQSKAGDAASDVLTYFDGRGNAVQHRAQMDATTFVVSGLRVFNSWGDPSQEFEPVFSTDAAYSAAPPPGAASRSFHYDGRGRPVRTVNYNGGVSTAQFSPFEALFADADDNDTSPANVARGQANTPRREEFDVVRMRTAIVEVLGGGKTMTTTYVNDALGRTIAIQDAAGTLCSYKCDALGNRYEISHRAAGNRKLWYDARNRVVRSLDASGNDLRVTTDALGRLQRLSSAGAILEEYSYGAPDSAALGRISSVTYRGGSQAFEYNASGQLARATFHFDGVADAWQTSFEYDVLGREVARSYSDGKRIERNLTFNGWISSIPGVITRVDYDPRGLPSKIAYANGVTTTIGYEPGPGRVNKQKTLGPHGEVYEDLTYTFDPLGILLTSADAAPAGRGAASYTYDPLYQLSSATMPGNPAVVRNYGYTNFLNLSLMDETNSAFKFDDPLHPDRVTGVSRGGGPPQDLEYDANGNLLGLGDKTFSYNEKNELTRVKRADGLTAEYAYDPSGLRMSKRVVAANGTVTQTLFPGAEIEIRDGKAVHYVFLGASRVCMISDDGPRFFHTDYAGSTSFFTDANGVKLASIVYRPFGNIDSATGNIDDRTYGLHPFDAESGLYYMRRRYYSPDLGRFLTPDPLPLYQPHRLLGNPKALHPYAYAGNDPLDNVDYSGLSFWSVVGAIAGAIVGVAAAAAIAVAVVATGGLAGVIIGLVMVTTVVSISYVIANSNTGNGVGEFFRGFLIGFNAGLNGALGSLIFGGAIGIALGVINFLAAFDGVAGNKVYQGILGWSSWIMPMSWLATGIGAVFFVINLIAAGVTWNGSWFGASGAHIDSIHIHWETGTIIMKGGSIGAMGGEAFDVGNFAFINSNSPHPDDDELHETGHALNVAAFGSIFHLVPGVIEQQTSSDGESYSEHLAESHDPTPLNPAPGTWWHMWGSPGSGGP
jgi:RHS repeat-associated protein